jgi:hypothetical protein
LYFKTKIPVIRNGIVEPVIFKLKVSNPITTSNNIRILKKHNPDKLSILLTCCWKIVYNIIICPKKGMIITGCNIELRSFFPFKNISASAWKMKRL